MSNVEFGRELTRGALRELRRWLFWAVVLVCFCSWAFTRWDGTDDIPGGRHSQMRLRIDYGTGCQYLESSDGSLTPRLGRDGRQVCR